MSVASSSSGIMSNTLLLIDSRENQFISLFTAKERTERFRIEAMSVGDFGFYVRNENGEDVPRIIIERKTEADLQSSIRDGRWREQKDRLDVLRSNEVHVLYIVERSEWRARSRLDLPLIQGAILNTLIRDNYPILYTDSLEHTVEMIETLYRKVERGDFQEQRGSALVIHAETKKRQLPKTDFLLLALSSIPRVSLAVAERIQERYASVFDLCMAYHELGTKEERENLLADIVVGKKRLGGKLSASIYQYLCNQTVISS